MSRARAPDLSTPYFLFLFVCGLSLSLLVLLLVLFPRMRLVSFSVASLASLSLLPRLLLLPLLVLTAFVPSLRQLLSLAMFPLPLFLLLRLGVLPLSSPLSICVTSSSLPLRGFLWVRWWRRMQLFNVLLLVLVLVVFNYFCVVLWFDFNRLSVFSMLQSPGSHRRLSTWYFIHYRCGRCVQVVASHPSPI